MSEIKRSIPWFTSLIVLLCIGMYISYEYLESLHHPDLEIYNKLGAPASLRIYEGQYWGVFWNSFLHNRIDLLIPNVIAVFLLGSYIERKSNFFNLFALGLLASTTTSIVQFTLTDNPGIGMTGVNLFFLSYIIGRGLVNDEFKMRFRFFYLVITLTILATSIVLNMNYNANIGTLSMISGLIFGFFLGILAVPKWKYLSKTFGILLFISLCTTLYYAPWSAEWNLFKAYKAMNKEDIEQAKHFYREVIIISPGNENALENLRIIKIDELCDTALKVHQNKDYLKARELYDEILEIDPNNEWVKQQKRLLP